MDKLIVNVFSSGAEMLKLTSTQLVMLPSVPAIVKASSTGQQEMSLSTDRCQDNEV